MSQEPGAPSSLEPETSNPEETPKAPIEIMLWGVLGLIILGLLGFSTWVKWSGGKATKAQPPLPIIATVPDFSFIDRDGSTISRQDFLGQPWVVDFIFTRCAAICPRMTYQMGRVVEALGDDTPVQFASFSVDPEHDTPEVLADYARHYEAPPRWHFLTGDREQLHALSREGFLLVIDDLPNPAAGSDPIVHSNRFVLVDQQGQVRSYYDAFDDVELDRLLDDIDELLAGE